MSVNSIHLVKLEELMKRSRGNPEVIIGLIDGPVDFGHSAFNGSKFKTIKHSQLSACKNASSEACIHGTFIMGILSAPNGISAPSICPNSTIIINPIFSESLLPANSHESYNTNSPMCTPLELSNAIIETIDAGAKIINLSVGLSTSSLIKYDRLQEAYDYAARNNVIIVVAAGNQGDIGNISLLDHPWIIPVAACDESGRIHSSSNLGYTIGIRGLMAPGIHIESTFPGSLYKKMSGTSISVPFVTGTIALLMSLVPKASPAEIRFALLSSIFRDVHRIIPPLLNAYTALNILTNLS